MLLLCCHSAAALRLSVRVQLTFEAAADRVKTLKDKPSNDVLLQIYALYKQATVGDCTGSQPWAVQVEARAKFDAWAAQKGQPVTAAAQQSASAPRCVNRCSDCRAPAPRKPHCEHAFCAMQRPRGNSPLLSFSPSTAIRFRSSLVSPLTLAAPCTTF